MDDGEDNDGGGECRERVPISPTPACSMGRPGEIKRGKKETQERRIGRGDEEKDQSVDEDKERVRGEEESGKPRYGVEEDPRGRDGMLCTRADGIRKRWRCAGSKFRSVMRQLNR